MTEKNMIELARAASPDGREYRRGLHRAGRTIDESQCTGAHWHGGWCSVRRAATPGDRLAEAAAAKINEVREQDWRDALQS